MRFVSQACGKIEHMFEALQEVATAPARPEAGVPRPGVRGGAEPEWVPSGLADMPPGPAVAVLAASVEVERLSGHDQVMMVEALQRLVSFFSAQLYRAITSVTDTFVAQEGYSAGGASEAAAAEIGAALHVTRRSAEHEVALADGLCRRLPTVWASLAAGDIDLRRARTILHGTDHMATGPARFVAESVLDDAAGLTTGQLAARLRRACIEADPDEARSRYDVAVDQRRVVAEATPAGTATLLGLDLPPHRLAAGMRRLNRLARAMRREGESRTMDQLRADVLLDLLAGTGVAAADTSGVGDRGMVDIHVDLATLAKLSESPGELAGYGPVIADIARQTADVQRRAEWRFTVTDGDGGDVVLTGLTRYRPTAAERRRVQALYPT